MSSVVPFPYSEVHTQKPFNGETPVTVLGERYITPNEVFYIRNHLPVPDIEINDYELEVSGLGVEKPLTLSLQQLQDQFPKHCIVNTFSCAGNRRMDMEAYKHVKGLEWGAGAIGTATWCGAKLVDVLQAAAFDLNKGARHMHFEGLDADVEGNQYWVSVPMEIAAKPGSDVLLAYQMNGQPIPLDHGYPVRALVPGVTAARSVKWLSRVVASDEESQGHFQQKDYKVWSSSVHFGDTPPSDAPAIQEMPVQSAICSPVSGSTIPKDATHVTVKGYAYSGGGRDIARVEVSSDGGETWKTATLQPRPECAGVPVKDKAAFQQKEWSWVLWSAAVPVPADARQIDLCCKCVDVAYNTQPEKMSSIWNMRGLLSNAYHHVFVKRQ